MSQSQTVILDDKEVSRRVALKATHDKVFECTLLACASLDSVRYIGKGSAQNYISVSHAILAIRTEMAHQAGLKVPLLNGYPQDPTPVLKKIKNSRVTAFERNREWGWVVSHQSCLQQHAISYLI